ncbi:MAG TPA: hypothetical protein GX010_01985 [Erysipelotrichaceae bacterium]|nr:hypothetical protein [Erysipelotrichaceae bacterium]
MTQGKTKEVDNRVNIGTKVVYYITLVISMLVGLWHFFVPHMFNWYDYLPMQYENLIVGINYTNLCFSALLFGSSLVLILLAKSAFRVNFETLVFYTFLTAVWVFRAGLSIFMPWPLEPIPAAAIGQLIGSIVLAVLMVVVTILLWINKRAHDQESHKKVNV